MNPIHTLITYFVNIYLNIILPSTPSSPNLLKSNTWTRVTFTLCVHFMTIADEIWSYRTPSSKQCACVVFLWEPSLQEGRPFYYALAFLHFIAMALNLGASNTIGILSSRPLGYVMQSHKRGQHTLCPWVSKLTLQFRDVSHRSD